LFEYDGTLFCGHDSGTFIIEKASVKNIFENQELGNLNRFPVKRALLQATMGFRYWKRSTISGVSGIK
jgi:hypothetical protein